MYHALSSRALRKSLLLLLLAAWQLSTPANAAIVTCPAANSDARIYALPFGKKGTLVALEARQVDGYPVTQLILYLPTNAGHCRAILVDRYAEEGAAAEVKTLFYQRINGQHNVVVLIAWEQHHRGIDMYGDYYKVYGYRLTPKGRLVANKRLQQDAALSGFDGVKAQQTFHFPYTNAALIRAYLRKPETAHNESPTAPSHVTVACRALAAKQQVYDLPIYAPLNAMIAIETASSGREQLVQYRPYGHNHCDGTVVATLAPEARIITLFFQPLGGISNLFIIAARKVNNQHIQGTRYRVIAYQPDGNGGLTENPAVTLNPAMSGLDGQTDSRQQHFSLTTAAAVRAYLQQHVNTLP